MSNMPNLPQIQTVLDLCSPFNTINNKTRTFADDFYFLSQNTETLYPKFDYIFVDEV